MASKLLFKRPGNMNKAAVASEESKEVTWAMGLRKCTEASDVLRAIDIVFVHGLTGSREKTWTHPCTSCFWPELLLFLDIPDARIFTYGYDADVAHFFSQASKSRIGDHAKSLMSELARTRELSDTNDRPLIFVAHSLGGLVVEDMLLSSKNSAELHHQQILEATEGIVFMGTPHCGSKLADWAKVFTSMAKLVKGLNESIISVLQPDSEVLARIQQEFHTMIRARCNVGKRQIRMLCFFEDHDTPGIGAVVPKHSAILAGHNSISIASDHSGMTKFANAQDPGYKAVSEELRIWIRDIEKKRERARTDIVSGSASSPPKPPMLLTQASNEDGTVRHYFMGSMQNVGQVFQGTNHANIQF